MTGTGTTERGATGGATLPLSRPAGRSAQPPVRRPELAHLSLDSLRSYRAGLMAEELRVSYWRRLVQARLDVLLAEELGAEPTVGDADPDGLLARLRDVLSDVVTAQRRQALLTIVPGDEAPPLPDLADLWYSTRPTGGDADGRLLRRLSDAEQALSSYRRVLHGRLDAATGELIARYHEEPARCLVALPQQPARPRLATA